MRLTFRTSPLTLSLESRRTLLFHITIGQVLEDEEESEQLEPLPYGFSVAPRNQGECEDLELELVDDE